MPEPVGKLLSKHRLCNINQNWISSENGLYEILFCKAAIVKDLLVRC